MYFYKIILSISKFTVSILHNKCHKMKKILLLVIAFINIIFSPSIIFAQESYKIEHLAEDIYIANLTEYKGVLYFSGSADPYNHELWKYENGKAELVQEINPALDSYVGSYPANFIVFNDILYFCANDGVYGYEFWKFDGDTAIMVQDIYEGYYNSYHHPEYLTIYRGGLYFQATDGVHGNELWKFDSDTAIMVQDIVPGYNSGSPKHITEYNDELYFYAHTKHTNELWKYNGDTATLVQAIYPTTDFGHGEKMAVLNDILYFSNTDNVHNVELWQYDGDTAIMVQDIVPGEGTSSPLELITYKGNLYFTGYTNSNYFQYERRLLKYDVDTVTLVDNIIPEDIRNLTIFKDKMYFSGYDKTHGYELWQFDGDTAVLVKDFSSSVNFTSIGHPRIFGVFNEALYFDTRDYERKSNLWRLNLSNNSLTFLLDSASGYVGDTVEVQVRAKSFIDIISAQGTIDWDTTVATLVSVQADALAHTQFNTSFKSKGKLPFSWYDPLATGKTLTDSTALFTLRFKLVGKEKLATKVAITSNLTPIEVTDKDLNVLKVAVQEGEVTIRLLSAISGKVYTEEGKPVADVEVQLDGFSSAIDSTDAGGTFSFTSIHPYQHYTLATTKNQNANFSQDITSLDLALIQKHILVKEKLASPYKIIAADVNESQSITTADIVEIQHLILGKSQTFSEGKLWNFAPATFNFADPTHPFPFDTVIVLDTVREVNGHDFMGIQLGNVGSAKTNQRSQLEKVVFTVKEVQVLPESEISVPVRVNGFNDISSFQLTLEWDPRVLQYQTTTSQVLSNMATNEALASEGKLSLLWYHPEGNHVSLKDNSEMVALNFKVIGHPGQFSPLAISSILTPLLVYNNLQQEMVVEKQKGGIEIAKVLGIDHQVNPYAITLASANPFEEQVNIHFTLSKPEIMQFKIINALGQVVYNSEQIYTAGHHELVWNVKDGYQMKVRPGIYFGQFSTSQGSQLIKLIKK